MQKEEGTGRLKELRNGRLSAQEISCPHQQDPPAPGGARADGAHGWLLINVPRPGQWRPPRNCGEAPKATTGPLQNNQRRNTSDHGEESRCEPQGLEMKNKTVSLCQAKAPAADLIRESVPLSPPVDKARQTRQAEISAWYLRTSMPSAIAKPRCESTYQDALRQDSKTRESRTVMVRARTV
jgi:hypothetical protein